MVELREEPSMASMPSMTFSNRTTLHMRGESSMAGSLRGTLMRRDSDGTLTLHDEQPYDKILSFIPRQDSFYDEENKKIDLENQREITSILQSIPDTHDAIESEKDEKLAVTSTTTDPEKAQPPPSNKPLYTVFTSRQKFFIVAICAWGGFISPISTAIYLPSLNTLAADFHVTASQINLTITTFMIVQAISPMFIGSFADSFGYRPAFIVCFMIYLAANIALAMSDSYLALLLLRMLQSLGSSGTISLRNGVIASVMTPAERGTALGLVQAGTLMGPAFGPAIGGALAARFGWRWIFWFLAIVTATALIPQLLFVPETNRKIVGNGTVPPWEWWNISIFDLKRRKAFTKETYDKKRKAIGLPPRAKLGWPNPWPSLVLLAEKDTAIVLLCSAINFAALYNVMTSAPVIYHEVYGFDTVKIAFVYIAIGGGAATAAILNGRLLDYNFRKTAKEHNLPVEKKRGQDLRNFPVEKARLRVAFPFLMWGAACLLAYGWVLEKRGPLPAAIVLAYCSSTGFVCCFSSMNNLLIDTHHESPATMTATANITRCLLGAVSTAVIQPMINAMGVGWCFTFWSGIILLSSPALFLIMKMGPRWREERWVKLDEKKEKEQRLARENSTARKEALAKLTAASESPGLVEKSNV